MEDTAVGTYFAELGHRLLEVPDVVGTVQVLVSAAVEVTEGCDHASISHLQGKALVSLGSTGRVADYLDGVQTGTQSGPCIDAIRLNQVIESEDLTNDRRWPDYGPLAAEAVGVVAGLAYPLQHHKRAIGAVNLFSESVGGFDADPEHEAVRVVMVAFSEVALVSAQKREGLQTALQNRDTIGMAKGLLMARTSISEEEAFDVLRRASQRLNVKLTEVASRYVSGDLPG